MNWITNLLVLLINSLCTLNLGTIGCLAPKDHFPYGGQLEVWTSFHDVNFHCAF
jgi:hypothetical protein